MGGYIILRITAGLNDALSILWHFSMYAKEHGRTIIFCLDVYIEELNGLIDFSDFPVPVLCGESHIKDVTFSSIEPSCYELDPYKRSDSRVKEGGYSLPSIGRTITRFDIKKSYPEDVLLIFEGFGNYGHALETMKHIKLTPTLLTKFYEQRNVFLEPVFLSIHLRATDYPGYNEENDIAKVDHFVDKYPTQAIYLASDNSGLVEKLCSKYSNLVRPLSYKKIDEKYHSLHYTFGKVDPDCLTNALIDILMCASADDFLQSRGGFSSLITVIRNTPDLLKKLLKLTSIEESGELQTSDSCEEDQNVHLTTASTSAGLDGLQLDTSK